jgi:Smg protein
MNNTRVLDAIGLIGRFVSDHWDSFIDHVEITDELADRGFTSGEINAAFLWIENNTLGPRSKSQKLKAKNSKSKKPEYSLRQLNALESAKIDNKAFGLLLQYLIDGLIDNQIMEDIIQRALQSENAMVGKKEMRRIAALTLFNGYQSQWKELLHRSNPLIQ